MKLIKHLTGYMPVSLANGLVGFAGVYVFTRLLGAEEYGRYALLFSMHTLIHTLTLSWAEAASFRFAGHAIEADDLPGHYRTALNLVSRSLLLTALAFGLIALYFRDDPAYLEVLPWLFFLAIASTFGQVALEAHRAHQRVGRYSLAQTGRIILGFIVGALVALLTGLGAAAPFVGLLFGALFVLFREGPWLFKESRGGKTNVTRNRAWLKFGIPVAGALALDILLSVSDRFLIKYFIDEAAVGAYAAGYGVADKPVLIICSWAALGAAPLLMEAFESEGKAAASKAAEGMFRTILFLGLPAAVGLVLVAEPLAEATISKDLSTQAAQIIPFIAIAGLLNGLLIHYVSESFQLVRRTDQRAILMAVPVVLNIALNIYLLPRLGVMGAVYATVFSYAFAVLLLGYFGRKLLVLPVPIVEVFKVGLAAVAMWPAIYAMPHLGGWAELFLKAIVGGVVYMIVALLLDAGGARAFLKSAIGRKGTV